MKITLIIPIYNAEATIEKCLSSIIRQERMPDQVLLIDNGSKDRTISIIEKFVNNNLNSNIALLHESKRGPAAARNKGLDFAEGDIIAFTDSDCFPREDWIKNMALLYEENDYDGISGMVNIYSPQTMAGELEAIDGTIGEDLIEEVPIKNSDALFGKILGTFNASYRKRVFDKIGRFDETFFIGEDVDLTIRAIEGGFKLFTWTPKMFVWHMPRNTFQRFIKKIFQYRVALPRLVKKHFPKRAIIVIPWIGRKEFPFFMGFVATKDMWLVLSFFLCLTIFYKIFAFIMLAFFALLSCMIFKAGQRMQNIYNIKTPIMDTIMIILMDIAKKTVSLYGKAYGSIICRAIYF